MNADREEEERHGFGSRAHRDVNDSRPGEKKKVSEIVPRK